jgi:hypothetical protein
LEDHAVKTILLVTGQDDLESARLLRNDDGTLGALLYGNAPLGSAFEGLRELKNVILGISGNQKFHVPQPDLVINLICDADANRESLSQAAALITQAGVLAINPPDKVMKTGRQAIAEMARDIPGLMTPSVVVLRPRRLREIEELWRRGGIPPEFLIRPLVGDNHGGNGLLRVASEADLCALEQYPFDGRAFGVTPFIDYRSQDGYYRKYRLFFVEGKAHPRHLIINADWMIHSDSRLSLMTGREDLQVEERRFLRDPRGIIGDVAWTALHQLARQTELDFVGADFTLLPDGRALLFECNAAMNVLEQGAGDGFPYLVPIAARIKDALRKMAARRI